VTSLRHYNKNAFVCLLVDDLTAVSLVGFRANLKNLVDEIKIVEFPKSMPQKERSRLLKTSMRNLVDGDFLYLDCDTIICSEINPNELPNCEIGAVLDLHMSVEKRLQNKIFPKAYERYANEKYFNSGVLYAKDTQQTRHFFDCWNKLLLEHIAKGYVMDQPALFQTNLKFNLITEFDGTWNSMPEYDVNYIHKARIMHFFSTQKSSEKGYKLHPLIEKAFYETIKQKQSITEEQLQIILNPKENFHPNTQLLGQGTLSASYVLKTLKYIYRKRPKLFNFLESFCAIFSKNKDRFVYPPIDEK
jgi:lipopolysaccharide biosynthesis glycosyltransferase